MAIPNTIPAVANTELPEGYTTSGAAANKVGQNAVYSRMNGWDAEKDKYVTQWRTSFVGGYTIYDGHTYFLTMVDLETGEQFEMGNHSVYVPG